MLICTEVFAEDRAILAILNSIYTIQTAANPCLFFRTVLRVRSERSQGNMCEVFINPRFDRLWQASVKLFLVPLDI